MYKHTKFFLEIVIFKLLVSIDYKHIFIIYLNGVHCDAPYTHILCTD